MRTTTIILFLLMSLTKGGLNAQNPAKQVLKKYTQKNVDPKNNGATLILFSDSTFINCSVFKDKQNQEDYVWYAYGKYVKQDTQIICYSPLKNMNATEMIGLIKANYRTRIDYRMINDYFEFVYEKYNGRVFSITQQELQDTQNQILYTETTIIN